MGSHGHRQQPLLRMLLCWWSLRAYEDEEAVMD